MSNRIPERSNTVCLPSTSQFQNSSAPLDNTSLRLISGNRHLFHWARKIILVRLAHLLQMHLHRIGRHEREERVHAVAFFSKLLGKRSEEQLP